MQDSNSNALTWVLGGALVLIGLFVVILLVSVNSQADSVTTTTTVTNVSPGVTMALAVAGSSLPTGTTANLTSGNTTSFVLTGTITDDNGVGTGGSDQAIMTDGDIQEFLAYVNNTSEACDTSNRDNNDCYASLDDESSGDAFCTLTVQTSTTADYSCTFNIAFYADSTSTGGTDVADTWTAYVMVTDDLSTTATSSFTFEMGTLLGLDIPASISYGTLAREGFSTNLNNAEMSIEQYGNDVADVEVSGTTMPCSVVGTVPIANQEWALTDLSHSTTGTNDLTGSAVDTNLAVNYRTNDSAAQTKTLYWDILIPTVASGTCTGTNTITAVAS